MDFYDLIKSMRAAGWTWDDVNREFDEACMQVADEEDADEED